MTRLEDNRWMYEREERGVSDEARAFLADCAVALLLLFATIGVITVARLFFGSVTP